MFWRMPRTKTLGLLGLFGLLVLGGCRSASELGHEPEQLIEEARVTLQSMANDSQNPGFMDVMGRARAVVIVPHLWGASFLAGGLHGEGVMLARNVAGTWSSPAFYTFNGLSLGLQFGGSSSEVILLVMTEDGVKNFLDRQRTLGGSVGVAVGGSNPGVDSNARLDQKANLYAFTGLDLKADIYAFARSRGLLVGVALDGSAIAPRNAWNQAVYGLGVTPKSILVDQTARSDLPAVRAIIKAMPSTIHDR